MTALPTRIGHLPERPSAEAPSGIGSLLDHEHREGRAHACIFSPGETGFEAAVLKAEDIPVEVKENLYPSRDRLRDLSHLRICDLAEKVRIAMACDRK